jgi:hypothetical protein
MLNDIDFRPKAQAFVNQLLFGWTESQQRSMLRNYLCVATNSCHVSRLRHDDATVSLDKQSLFSRA